MVIMIKNIKIGEEIHKKLKIESVNKNTTITNLVELAINKYLNSMVNQDPQPKKEYDENTKKGIKQAMRLN